MHKVTVFYHGIQIKSVLFSPFISKIKIVIYNFGGSCNNVSGVYYIIAVFPFDVKCIKAT